LSLFSELKRRNVFKVAAAYLIVSWLLLQVSDVLVPALRLPDWFHSGVAFLLMLGFPVAMIFAWAFELTPDGLKRDHEVDRSQSTTPQTGRKLDYIIIGLLVVALGYFAYDKFVLGPARDAELVKATADAASGNTNGKSVANDKSIAVLPFVNMSSDAEQEYFSDGLSEEMLNLLAKIPDLQVIARTSSFAYKGKDVKIGEVASELNVAHVLEGSVRKSGNQVRITAQLIRASDSTHLWSETYDRTLDNIFVIQDEIASAVVKQLRLKIVGATPQTREVNPEAYELYLYARERLRQHTIVGVEQAVLLFKQALAIEPDYAEAWVGLARSYEAQTGTGTLPFDEGRRLGREAAKQALTIDPEYAPAYAWLAASQNLNELASAAQYCQRAIELNPTDPAVLTQMADMLSELGRLDEAITVAEIQLTRDPVNSVVRSNLGYYLRWAGRLDESIGAFRAALSLVPGRMVTHYRIGEALLLKGELPSALAEMQQEPEEVWRLIGFSLVYHALGQQAESNKAVEKLIDLYGGVAAYNIAYIYAFRGEVDRAFEWLDRAKTQQDSGLSQITQETLFENIHEDPRWPLFLERIGRSPEQLAAIEFKVTMS
jgi:TolB-like protein/Flp pilus assembly protein TadD